MKKPSSRWSRSTLGLTVSIKPRCFTQNEGAQDPDRQQAELLSHRSPCGLVDKDGHGAKL